MRPNAKPESSIFYYQLNLNRKRKTKLFSFNVDAKQETRRLIEQIAVADF